MNDKTQKGAVGPETRFPNSSRRNLVSEGEEPRFLGVAWLVRAETFYYPGHFARIGDSDMRVDDVSLPVKDEQSRRGAYVVQLGHGQAGRRGDVDADELGTTLKLLGDPVHDRLGDQAGRSAVGEKVHDGRLASLHLAPKVGGGGQRRACAAQRKPGQRQADDDEQAYPILTQEAQDGLDCGWHWALPSRVASRRGKAMHPSPRGGSIMMKRSPNVKLG